MNKKYVKKFDDWNERKKGIDGLLDYPFFFEGEIWWCSIGINVDVEMDGKNILFERPVLIVKKINLESAYVAPITSSYKDSVYIYKLDTIPSNISLSQMRSLSAKRLIRKFAKISFREYVHIMIRIKYIFTPQNETPPSSGESRGPEGIMITF